MNKISLIFLFALVILPSLTSAQKTFRPFKVKLKMMDKQIKKGYLFNITRSQILLVRDDRAKDITPDTLDVSGINKIILRKKGKMGRSIAFVAIPATVGLGAAATALNTPKDPSITDPYSWFVITDGEAFVSGAVAGAFFGIIIGSIVGLTNSGSYQIEGKQPVFDKYFSKIKEKCIIRE